MDYLACIALFVHQVGFNMISLPKETHGVSMCHPENNRIS